MDYQKFIDDQIAEIKKTIGSATAINALSGGVDSSVVTVLGHRAIGDQLKTVFVDNAIMREGEPQRVVKIFADVGINVDLIDARKEFLDALAGKTDPEEKRQAITDTFYADVFSRLVKESGAKFLFHSCGAIRPVIDDLIEIGVDILDPLQAAADGMDPQALKDAHCDRLCLHGGICIQHLLPEGSPAEVRREVQRRLEILGAGGGYILSPCHVLQADVPTENILAMSDTGFESGPP